jgi:signal transduction histidine kinase
VVAAAYVTAAVGPLARSDAVTLALSAVVALTAFQVFLGTSGPARNAGRPALVAALAFAGVLALGAGARMADRDLDEEILWTYDLVIASLVLWLLVDLLRGRWADAVVTGLVVDLGATGEAGTLRRKLANALGDPSLVVGYRPAGGVGYVDDAGRPVELPGPGSNRALTPIDDGGEQVAVLVHDDGVLADRGLLASVAAAAKLAVANARLQAEARTRAAELQASRRRIVEAADAQRRRLEHELRHGAERRLERVATLLDDAEGGEELEAALEEARRELREFAYGVHPTALAGGLEQAIALLADRSPVPVELDLAVGPLSEPIETALYFVCSEALANVAKHASASHVRIEVRCDPARVLVLVSDDGRGGADPAGGTGLRGLADRVEAFGGRLRVDSAEGRGTRLEAEIPSGHGSAA